MVLVALSDAGWYSWDRQRCNNATWCDANIMMASSNGNIFRVTGPLCGEFTGPGEFPTQRPVTRSFDVFFDLRLNKRLSKQPRGWWFETPSWSLWRQCNVWKNGQWPPRSVRSCEVFDCETSRKRVMADRKHPRKRIYYNPIIIVIHQITLWYRNHLCVVLSRTAYIEPWLISIYWLT